MSSLEPNSRNFLKKMEAERKESRELDEGVPPYNQPFRKPKPTETKRYGKR